MSRGNIQVFFLVLALAAVIIYPRRPGTEASQQVTVGQQITSTSVRVLPVAFESRVSASVQITAAPGVKAAVVKKLSADEAFLAVNTDERWPIASLTKLMTAVVALEKFPATELISFNEAAIASEGAAAGFRAGEQVALTDVVKALISVSSNDAAMAIAFTYGYPQFIAAMQAKAAELGMRHTTFTDPTGLSFLNQSTIEDLERLATYAYLAHPEIFAYSRQPQLTVDGRMLVNINTFSGRDDFLGGKTGYTDDANGNLLSLFSDPEAPPADEPLLIIVLGTDDRFGTTEALLQEYRRQYRQ